MIFKEVLKIKKILFIFLSFFIIAIIIWIIMQINTNSILKEVEGAIFCEDYYILETQKGTYESEKIINNNKDINFVYLSENEYKSNLYAQLNLLRKYNILHLNQYDIKCNIKRNYTIHNFKEGYIWLNYDLSIKSKKIKNCENPNIDFGGNFLVKLKIKKVNENWLIENIWTPDHWCNEQMERDYWLTSKMN